MKEQPIVLVEHPARPAWGRCLISAERDGKVFLLCEDGEERAVALSHRGNLTTVTLGEEEARAHALSLQEKRARALGKRIPRGKPRKTAPRPPRATFDEQLARFAAAFPGGFTGEAFTAGERGTPEQAGSRQHAIARAQALLAPASLEGGAGYERAMALLADVKLIHPMEGALALRTMPEEHRAGFSAALVELLYGAGEFVTRFDAFVAAVKLSKPDGEAKRPSWPFVTLFAGLSQPTQQAFVKPKLLLEQAAILNAQVDYDPLPSGKVYEQLLALLRDVESRLKAAGHSPRDLMDVGAFVITTLQVEKTADAN